jgi:hypothetical protein
MMKREELAITIDSEGRITIKVQGVKGKACLQTTRSLEAELGAVEKRDLTQEYYQQESIAGLDRLQSGL